MRANPIAELGREFVRSLALLVDTVAETLWPAPAVQRAHAAAEALADVEAEEEVAEPYCGPDIQPGDRVAYKMPDGALRTEIYGGAGGSGAPWPPLEASLADVQAAACAIHREVTAGQPNDGLRELCDLLDLPHSVFANAFRDIADDLDPPHKTTPAGVDGSTPPPAGLDWLGWAVPAVLEVLSDHQPHLDVGRWGCFTLGEKAHAYFFDMDDWREHVAPLIAERIACDLPKAIAALQSFQPK